MGPVPPIRARLLGQTELAVGERPLPIEVWPRRAARSLLLLLLTTPGLTLHRDQAIEALWPERSADSGLNNFYKALHALRRVLQPDLTSASDSAYIVVSAEHVGVRPDAAVEVDLDRFGSLLSKGQTASVSRRIDLLWEAIALYRGDLIADEPYTDWLQARRDQIRQLWQGAALDLATLTRTSADPARIVPVLQTVLATEPTNEAVHLALMQSLAAIDPVRALRQYDQCVKALRNELGVDPTPETRAFAYSLRSVPGPAPFLTEPRPVRRRQILPVPPTPLIGRERDLREIEDLLLSDRVRLVTLVGPGGIGKTHLALETARSIASEFADGVAFVSLAPLRDPALVLPTIARSLGLDERSAPLERIAEALADASVLLVIDNFEQVIAAATDIAALLANMPGLNVLVTSRERLRVRGEHEYPVAPLPTLSMERPPSLAVVARNPAAQLFTERVVATRSRFVIDLENAAAIVGICRRLDGIPLAIELAAARARDLDPPELLARLQSRSVVLADGPRDLPDRLRTMRDAVAWSYDLLTPEEQALFRRLGIFVGGFDGEVVALVNRALGETDAHHDLDAVLHAFVDKSLIVRQPFDRSIRYRLLEPIRDCAVEYLDATGEAEATARAHAAVFADIADEARTGVDVAQAEWVDWFDHEVDNLRQAFAWAVQAADGQTALRIATGLRRLWKIRGRSRESFHQIEAALLLNPGLELGERAILLLFVASMAIELDEYARAEETATEALTLAESVGDHVHLCRALHTLSSLLRRRSDYARAKEFGTRALAIARATGDRSLLQETLHVVAGVQFDQGDRQAAQDLVREGYESYTDDDPVDRRLMATVQLAASLIDADPETVPLCDEVLEYARRHGYPEQEAWGHMTLGYYRLLTGELDSASMHSRTALALYHEIGNRWAWAGTLCNLALTEWIQGDHASCIANGRSALRTMWTLGDRRYVGLIVSHFGGMCRVAPTLTANIRLLSAGIAELTAIDSSPDAALSGRDVAWKAELCADAGAEAFAAAWARGQATPIGVAVEAILSDAGYPG